MIILHTIYEITNHIYKKHVIIITFILSMGFAKKVII